MKPTKIVVVASYTVLALIGLFISTLNITTWIRPDLGYLIRQSLSYGSFPLMGQDIFLRDLIFWPFAISSGIALTHSIFIACFRKSK